MKRRKAIKICFHSAAYAGIFAMVGNSLSSCTTDHVYELSFEFFDEEKGKILSIISDLMIPESDTPGAIDVGVPYSIDRYVANFLPEKNQMELVNGLGMIDKLSLQLFSNKFTELSTKEMSQTLAYLSQDAAKVKDQSTHLFYLLRKLIVQAYFESEQIIKTVLKSEQGHGSYIGCVKISG